MSVNDVEVQYTVSWSLKETQRTYKFKNNFLSGAATNTLQIGKMKDEIAVDSE